MLSSKFVSVLLLINVDFLITSLTINDAFSKVILELLLSFIFSIAKLLPSSLVALIALLAAVVAARLITSVIVFTDL